ncbi:AraC family transcriptional regulator [Pseudomonas sp. CBSPBW29]|uniref:helix-turn-helix domain-containing protein n=1 Tax=Pseudomonas sp. CBS TaxID=2971912 RepID=UPI0021AB9DCD|nr:AraC family transcriptional regulator [Pseudomonas sp. CBS]WEL43561.1 AraC family transcriptional regulator [Pseudomonas sp. CBSPBW29]WEL64633.1 AraC family transcriptional regulator [Pseudomonas sp. CBSPGW29]WEL68098.1 AraC family transcriptional regulator [Pseudomonas sp. CBSPCGW29]WEL75121.1 AraC family transcriptional regulator [Pseudomonas sp. CBSPAW29]WEL80634.1 AraC family transcriptional regulator [Pseudomonas sp. CBSPCAW29]
MSDVIFSSSHLAGEALAVKYFDNYCFEMDVRPGARGQLECMTKMCKIGSSIVSLTTSSTGWGYEARSGADGFLFTIPQSGTVTWESPKQRIFSKVGNVSLLDHREVVFSNYSQGAQYVTFYLSQEDVVRYLTLLIGEPPVSRVNFAVRAAGEGAAKFMTGLADLMISAGSNRESLESKVLTHLKESLICFVLYNVENNYSKNIRSSKTVASPVPYSIKRTAEYIHANYDKSLILSDLAVFSGVSIRSLQLGFKQFKGTTPMAYLRKVRLDKAHSMLADYNSSLSPKEVADLCGFTDFYLFNKYYLMAFGQRPIDTMRSRLFL